MKEYGMSLREYDRMFKAAKGKCECCGYSPHAKGYPLCVDHCHTTGRVRGLLCNRCNNAIGRLGDDAEGLRRALSYLERTTDEGV